MFTATLLIAYIDLQQNPVDKHTGPGAGSLSLQMLRLQRNHFCLNHPIRVMLTRDLKDSKPTHFQIKAI